MGPEDRIQIDYRMEKRELAEMCARALFEMFARQKIFLTVCLILAVYGILDLIMNLTGAGRGHVFGIGFFMIVFVVVYFLTMFVVNYRHFVKSGLLEPQRIRLESGYLITGLNGTSRFPCRSYSVIKKGHRIVMIGTRISSRITSYIGIPKRVFSCREDQDAFLWLLANSVLPEDGMGEMPVLDRGGDMVLSFDISEERWARVYGEMVRILSDASLLGHRHFKRIYTAIGIIGCVLLALAAAGNHTVTGCLIYLILFLAGAGSLLIWGGAKSRSSDYRYREMAAKGTIQNDTLGSWEIGIRPDGGYFYHNEKYVKFQWSEYCHFFDMGDTLFFFDKSEKRYFFIPKEILGSQEDAAHFYDYFGQMGMTFRVPSAASNWSAGRIVGVVMLAAAPGLAIVMIAGGIYTSFARTFSRMNEEIYSYHASGYQEETEPFVFRPEDYPAYMPLAIQIEVLKSLGIEPPDEEEMKQYQRWMEEDDSYRAYIEGTPYVGILGEMGVGEYDETTEEYICHPSVYWFDFEGWDISEDYLDILNAFQVMGGGDFELTDQKEDLQNVDWEEGTGAILVMFRYNQNAYAFEARVMYDWIDPGFLGFFNQVLEQERNPKRIYFMDDGGQGAILFYNTDAWAMEFYSKTGIRLEALTWEGAEPWIPA